MKCFVRPVISIKHQKDFIEELVLEAISCLAKLGFAKEKKLKEGRDTFQEEGCGVPEICDQNGDPNSHGEVTIEPRLRYKL